MPVNIAMELLDQNAPVVIYVKMEDLHVLKDFQCINH